MSTAGSEPPDERLAGRIVSVRIEECERRCAIAVAREHHRMIAHYATALEGAREDVALKIEQAVVHTQQHHVTTSEVADIALALIAARLGVHECWGYPHFCRCHPGDET